MKDPNARPDSPLHCSVSPPRASRVSWNEFESLENKINVQEIQSVLPSFPFVNRRFGDHLCSA